MEVRPGTAGQTREPDATSHTRRAARAVRCSGRAALEIQSRGKATGGPSAHAEQLGDLEDDFDIAQLAFHTYLKNWGEFDSKRSCAL